MVSICAGCSNTFVHDTCPIAFSSIQPTLRRLQTPHRHVGFLGFMRERAGMVGHVAVHAGCHVVVIDVRVDGINRARPCFRRTVSCFQGLHKLHNVLYHIRFRTVIRNASDLELRRRCYGTWLHIPFPSAL